MPQHALEAVDVPRHLHIRCETAAERVRIYLQDNGPGIDAAHLQKIFEPFFSTKPEGQGTGLGLSICYDIVQAHHGALYVSSQPGLGTIFIIELPLKGPSRQSDVTAGSEAS